MRVNKHYFFGKDVEVSGANGYIRVLKYQILADNKGPEMIMTQEQITIPIVKGVMLRELDEDGKPKVSENAQSGTTIEALLEGAAAYLNSVNIPPYNSRYTSMAISKIEEAIALLARRSVIREVEDVLMREQTTNSQSS